MAGGWGLDYGHFWGRTSIDVQPTTQHSWVPRMSNGQPIVVDIRGGKTTANEVAPASAPGVTGFTALTMDEQFATLDAAKWTAANSIVSGAVTFMSANAVAGTGSLGASNGSSLKLSTKRITVGATNFTGGQITSTAALDTPLYGYFMARVKIPHGQGVSPIWQMAAKNNAAISSVTVQYLHAVTPGRISITYAHQTAAGVSATPVTANVFFEAPSYTPGWHTLALSVEPVNGVDAAGGVMFRAYLDGTKFWETTDSTATYWVANGGTTADFWTTTWKGSQVGGAFVAGVDDALGVDTARSACSISGTYPGACVTTATDGRSILRAGASGSTATLGTDATTFELDYIRAWAFTAFASSVTGSFTTTTTWAWADSAVLGNTPGPDQFAAVDVTGLTADDNHVAAIRLRAGTAGDVLVGVSDRTWRIEVTGGSVFTGAFTAGATSGKLDAELVGSTVKIYWTPTAGARGLIATQAVTMAAGIASQTGVKLSIWQSDATLNLTGLTATSTAVVDTTPGTAPAAPTLSGSGGNGQALLSWNTVSGATSYTLRQGTTVLATQTGTTYTRTGLTNGTAYSFTVTASNSAGTSAASNVLSITPQAPVTTGTWKSGASGDYVHTGAFGTWRGKAVTFMGDWADDLPANSAAGDTNLGNGGKYQNWTGDADIAIGGLYQNNGETWANFAAGAYNARMIQCFQNLWGYWTNKQRGQLYVRFAHEWNGGWGGIYQVRTTGDVPAFKASWHLVRQLQQQYMPGAKLVCCTNGNGMTYGAGAIGGVATAMPAAADFDVYGSDIYSTHLEQNSNVFEQHKAIADAFGKPFAVPEWGLHKGEGTPDSFNPTYLNKINSFGRAGNILYDVYFNVNLSSDYQIYPDLGYFPIGGPYYRTLNWGA